MTAEINLSRINPYKEQKISVIGEFGAAIFDDTKEWTQKVTVHKGKVEELDQDHVKTIPDLEGEASILKSEQPLKLELEHFVHCITTNSKTETPADEAIEIMKILMAAEESIEKKKIIVL
jgi:predicted dehydrogenase